MVKAIFYVMFLVLVCPVYAEEHGEAKKEGGKKEGKGSLDELKVQDMIVPVLLQEDVQAYYNLSFTIHPKDDSKKEDLVKFAPRITDAVLMDLLVVLPVIWNKDSMPSMELIKKRIDGVAKKATPEGTTGDVTIQAFQVVDAKHRERPS